MIGMIDWNKAPDNVRGGLQRYIESRIPPGHFLTAVLENNLKEACGRADDINRHELFEIVQFLYNEVPSACWGSPQNVREWLRRDEEAA